VGGLPANFIGAAIMRSATGKSNRDQQYDGRKLHLNLDANESPYGWLELQQRLTWALFAARYRAARSRKLLHCLTVF